MDLICHIWKNTGLARASCHAILKNLLVMKGLGILQWSLKAFCVKFEIISAVYLWNWYPDFMSLVVGYILTFLSNFTSAMNQNFVKFGEIFFFLKKRRGIFSIFTGFIWNALVPFKVFLCFKWNFHISNERIYMRRLIKKNHAFEFRTWTKTLISLRFTNPLE